MPYQQFRVHVHAPHHRYLQSVGNVEDLIPGELVECVVGVVVVDGDAAVVGDGDSTWHVFRPAAIARHLFAACLRILDVVAAAAASLHAIEQTC